MTGRMIHHARALRAGMTEAERHLWRLLRRRQFGGVRFRRQAPLGRYVADFACFDPKVVIELDGGQHSDTAHAARDGARDAWFRGEGFAVLRFWNNDVLANTDGVMQVIHQAVAALQGKCPPP